MRPIFDIEEWKKNQAQRFVGREDALMLAIAAAEPDQRPQARLDLARFYMAWGMYQEAKGEAEVILADPGAKAEESIVRMVHAIACIVIGRPGQGLKDLATSHGSLPEAACGFAIHFTSTTFPVRHDSSAASTVA